MAVHHLIYRFMDLAKPAKFPRKFTSQEHKTYNAWYVFSALKCLIMVHFWENLRSQQIYIELVHAVQVIAVYLTAREKWYVELFDVAHP